MGHDKLTREPAGALLRPASARCDIAPFMVMDVMSSAARREAAGGDVIHMEVGQPGTAAPKAAITRLGEVLHVEPLGYTLALGTPELRARIARSYQDLYGLDIAPERVVVTNGSSAAFVLAFLALFDAGEKVMLPSPGYPCYRHILGALGQQPIIVATDAAGRWMPTTAQIEAADESHDLAGLLIASPNNPTGTMLTRQRMGEIVSLCERRKIWFISDEIYHGLVYDEPAQSALAYSDNVIVINSFSKYFSMTGWRVGWMVVPEALLRVIERLAQNLYIAAPTASQVAALAAFDGIEELEANRQVYEANRALLLRELPKAGLGRIVPADGAFYLYVDVSAITEDSLAFAARMLEETGVAATPGLDFDEARGRQFIRFSYAGTTRDMAEAAKRLQAWLRPGR